jgi:U3 small nucleolar RNA-associated protein 21
MKFMTKQKEKLPTEPVSSEELAELAERTSLYAPFRVLGLVTNDGSPGSSGAAAPKPCCYELGVAPFVIVPIGRCLQLYDGRSLRLLGLSNPFPSSITATAHLGRERLVVATEHDLFITDQLRPCLRLPYAHRGRIAGLFSFQNGIFIAVDSVERCLRVFSRDNEITGEVFFGEDLTPNGLVIHPPAFLDVVCVGSKEGRLALVDIHQQRVKQTVDFTAFGPITTLAESPALDIIGIGFENGNIVVFDVRRSRIVDQYDARTYLPVGTSAAVNALCFRNDEPQAFPHLLSIHAQGTLCIYDLDQQRLLETIDRIHNGPCRMACFYRREPILLTVGDEDNRMNMYICDSPGGVPRLLKFRAGHRAPPTRVRFLGDDHRQLVSGGSADQQLRVTSTITSYQHREFSQMTQKTRRARKRIRQSEKERRYQQIVDFVPESDPERELLLPPVTDFAISDARQHDPDFANLITCHLGTADVYTWRYEGNHRFRHILQYRDDVPEQVDTGTATCVSISTCGHFAAVGLSTGHIDLFNLQSGSHRWRIMNAHQPGGVAGVAFDGSGGLLASVGTHEGRLAIYRHQTRERVMEILIGSPCLHLIWSPVSDLIAISCADDFSIRVYDPANGRCVRELGGHTARITDLCFSPVTDGRQILSTALDGTLRTWDLVAGRCIDVLRMTFAPTSCSMSPKGDFVVTTHVGRIGIYMWLCKAYYRGPREQGNLVALATLGQGEASLEQLWMRHPVRLPDLATCWHPTSLTESEMTSEERDASRCLSITIEPPGDEHFGVVFSNQPETYWMLLPFLNKLHARNRPPEQSSFDAKGRNLASLASESFHADLMTTFPRGGSGASSMNDDESVFVAALKHHDYEAAAGLLDTLNPAAADVELRLLPTSIINNALDFFTARLQKEHHFELVQAQLRTFLDEHVDRIMQNPALRDKVSSCLQVLEKSWQRSEDTLSRLIFLSGYLRG